VVWGQFTAAPDKIQSFKKSLLLFLVDYEKESQEARKKGSKLFKFNEVRITVHLRDVDVVEFRNLCWALLS